MTRRGYGESARASSYACGDFAADVYGFADALGLGAFVLLGHSFGGGSTSHVPQRLLAEAAELIPDARLVTLEGAGHTAHRTQPERFAAEVRAFLGAPVAGA